MNISQRERKALSRFKKERKSLFVDFPYLKSLLEKAHLLTKRFNVITISNLGPKNLKRIHENLPFKSVNHRNPMVLPSLSQKRHPRTMVLSLKLKLDKPSFDDSHRELSPNHNEVLITK